MKAINFEDITLRIEASHRGGGIEISLDTLGFKDAKMTAYQNYLGGGMLGKICSDCTISDFGKNKKLSEISERLMKYFHSLTNHEDDQWEAETFEQNQNKPTSAY